MKTYRGQIVSAGILGLIWVVLQQRSTFGDLIVGCVLGAVIVRATRHFAAGQLGIRHPGTALRLLLAFGRELVVSTLQVAAAIVRPRLNIRPAFIVVPLDLTDDLSITILANMITLTPGTLTLDLAPDRSALYVHCLSADDVDAVRMRIKDVFERPIATAFTCSTSPLS